MMIKKKYLFGFINDFEMIVFGVDFKLILKRNDNNRALFRVIAGAGAVANDCRKEIRDITWCVPCINPSDENIIIVEKGLSKKNN